ncbi:MAG: eae [Firmicutes bacterium]|nr:eae [Bacillota bacterium]
MVLINGISKYIVMLVVLIMVSSQPGCLSTVQAATATQNVANATDTAEKNKTVGEDAANIAETDTAVAEDTANIAGNDKIVVGDAVSVAETDATAAKAAANITEKNKPVAKAAASVAEKNKPVAKAAATVAGNDKIAAEDAASEAEADKIAADGTTSGAKTDKIAADGTASGTKTDKIFAEDAASEAEADKIFAEDAASETEADKIVAEDTAKEVEAAENDTVAETSLTIDKTGIEQATAADKSNAYEGLTEKEKRLAIGNNLVGYLLNNAKQNGSEWMKRTEVSLSFGDDNKPLYSLESLQPLGEMNDIGGLWFWQGRYAHTGENSSTANLGLGWRKLSLDKSSIVGFNTFYDYGFQYNLARVGLGAEYFNKLAEYRANWYHPVTGEREIDSVNSLFIRAVEGMDIEAGTSFVHMPWLKVYAGGYYWDNKYHDDEIGYRLRSTMQLTSQLRVELGYTNSNLSRGLYGTVAYQLAFGSGKHSLQTKNMKTNYKQNDLTDKMLQKVERQNDIKTETYSKNISRDIGILDLYSCSVPYITLTVTSPSGVTTDVTADSEGHFTLTGLPNGTWTYVVKGYTAVAGSFVLTSTTSTITIPGYTEFFKPTYSGCTLYTGKTISNGVYYYDTGETSGTNIAFGAITTDPDTCIIAFSYKDLVMNIWVNSSMTTIFNFHGHSYGF